MITWNEVTSCTDGGPRWEASFPSDTHMIDIWPHEKEGFSWCVITDDVEDNAPEGWSPTVEDAKRHAEQAYEEWVDEHDETADIVAHAVAEERAAVVAFLREQAGQWDRDAAGWAALNHASVMVEGGLHRPGRA